MALTIIKKFSRRLTKLGCKFKDEDLLCQVFLLWLNPQSRENEYVDKLEFYGDKLMAEFCADYLEKTHFESLELSQTSAIFGCVNGKGFLKRLLERELGIVDYLAEMDIVYVMEKRYADFFEGLLKAMHVDSGGKEMPRAFYNKLVGVYIDDYVERGGTIEPKTMLQNLLVQQDQMPRYLVLEENKQGDPLSQWSVAVMAGDEILGEGKGFTKKDAEKKAACAVLDELGLEYLC